MGSFAKALSQLAAARLGAPASATSSRGILQTSVANKSGLSLLLDGTLKEGHDMKTFGLGTAASLASVSRYARMTSALRHIYGAMERGLDASTSPATAPIWKKFGEQLRREPSLSLDLADVADAVAPANGELNLDRRFPPTPATLRYVEAIEAAAAKDEEDGGGRLIGHAYCRYFADLFGGQMLAAPTRFALAPSVLAGTPRHYDFGSFGANRKANIEQLYVAFNAAGEQLGSDTARAAVVDESRTAFAHNVALYSEDGRLWSGAARGVANMAAGFARDKLNMPRAAPAV